MYSRNWQQNTVVYIHHVMIRLSFRSSSYNKWLLSNLAAKQTETRTFSCPVDFVGTSLAPVVSTVVSETTSFQTAVSCIATILWWAKLYWRCNQRACITKDTSWSIKYKGSFCAVVVFCRNGNPWPVPYPVVSLGIQVLSKSLYKQATVADTAIHKDCIHNSTFWSVLLKSNVWQHVDACAWKILNSWCCFASVFL